MRSSADNYICFPRGSAHLLDDQDDDHDDDHKETDINAAANGSRVVRVRPQCHALHTWWMAFKLRTTHRSSNTASMGSVRKSSSFRHVVEEGFSSSSSPRALFRRGAKARSEHNLHKIEKSDTQEMVESPSVASTTTSSMGLGRRLLVRVFKGQSTHHNSGEGKSLRTEPCSAVLEALNKSQQHRKEKRRRARSLERNHRHLVNLDEAGRYSRELSSLRTHLEPWLIETCKASESDDHQRYHPDPLGPQRLARVSLSEKQPRIITTRSSVLLEPLSTSSSNESDVVLDDEDNDDRRLKRHGTHYDVTYVGRIAVLTSMRTLDFENRSGVVRHCIERVAGHRRLRLLDAMESTLAPAATSEGFDVRRVVSSCVDVMSADVEARLQITSESIDVCPTKSGKKAMHSLAMPNVSFASCGEVGSDHFVAFVAKEENNDKQEGETRFCYVLKCQDGKASQRIINTIGQAFDLRFRDFLARQEQKRDEGRRRPDLLKSLSDCEASKKKDTLDVDSASNPGRSSGNLLELGVPEQSVGFSSNTFFPSKTSKRSMETTASSLGSEPWFHGLLSRVIAEELVECDGDFLVRESPANPGQFVLTGMQEQSKKHLLLLNTRGEICTRERSYESVSSLISFHMSQSVPISTLMLRRPITRLNRES